MTLSNPDLSSKLAAPPKKSIFERQKAEAEAKKAREKAETAAVLEDFVKSFEDEGGEQFTFPTKRGFGGGVGSGPGSGPNTSYGPGPGKRHFTSSGLKSGPGSLGPNPSATKSGPGSLGPGPSFGKKRHYDEFSSGRDRDRDRERRDRMFSFSDDRDRDREREPQRESGAFSREEEEDARDADELKAAAKPTLHLSSLPPGTSPSVVEALLLPSPLKVENVRILPTSTQNATSERKSVSAIVTLAAETPATDIDTMVSHLQNKYLGFGFNLSISRHLSSVALTGATSLSNTAPFLANLNNLPFGAKPVPQHTSLSRAPPPGQGPGRFAPPASYTSSTPYAARSNTNILPTQVHVQTPNDLRQLRLIHKTLEALLTYGPEFEALLMSRPQIQRAEEWSWLWNSRSTSGVYYRWRLWEILTDAKTRRRRQHSASGYGMRAQGDVLFEGQSTWIPPEEGLKFEYTTKIEEFISDDDYNSSDEEDMADGGSLARRYHDHQKIGGSSVDAPAENDGVGYLNPLAKTKLVHLLSRLPESNAKLRKGDVARVTGFAIEHAGAGADEVAALITRNVVRPFCYNVKKSRMEGSDDEDRHDDEQNGPKARPDPPDPPESSNDNSKLKERDVTPASLVGLYIISDILSSSASAGVRHAWRYRSLFETQLRVQNVFPTLGRAATRLDWGKLKAEKWRRSVQSVLSLWEGWCVFAEKSQGEFVEGFLNPPVTEKEKEKLAEEKEKERRVEKEKSVSRWRSVDDSVQALPQSTLDGKPMLDENQAAVDSDVEMNMDGTPMADDDEYDDEHLTDSNIDGEPMVDSSDDEQEPVQKADDQAPPPTSMEAETEASANPVPPPQPPSESSVPEAEATAPKPASTSAHVPLLSQGRRRPKAADFDDMFE